MLARNSGGSSVGRIHSFGSEWARLGIARTATVVCSILLFLAVLSIQLPTSSDPSEDLPIPTDSPEENEKMDTDPPVAPVLASAVLEGPNNENILISWSLSDDDGGGDNDVSRYAIYYSNVHNYEGEGYSYLGEANKGETIFIHSLSGDGDWSDYFYYVQANDTSGNGNWSAQAGKSVRYLEEGKQIVSIPLIQEDTTLEVVLQSLDGSYKHVRYYKSSDQSDHWKSYWTFKTYRTLFDIDHTMGFWIDITRADDLVVAGLVPEVTQIALSHEWNFVGYPSFVERSVSNALAGMDWLKIQGYDDVPPFNLRQMTGNDMMQAGEGYWIWVDLPQTWEVSNMPAASPYIVWTDPADGETGVSFNASIWVKFSEEMNTSSVIWTMAPDPSLCAHYWWDVNTLLEVRFANPWTENTSIAIQVDGKDLDGNFLVLGPVPNPWSFTTGFGDAPYIVTTDPFDAEVDVPLDYPVTIWFSEPMDISSVTLTVVPFLGYQPDWSNNNVTLTLYHTFPYSECVQIEIAIYGLDLDGNPLGPGPVPNPFYFCTGCISPYILVTDPSHGEEWVPTDRNISIRFSEPMNTSSVFWTVTPDPGPGGWSQSWYDNDMLLVLSHSFPFAEATLYVVIVIDAQDKSGQHLIPGPVPNSWEFYTGAYPFVVYTYPANNSVDIPLNASIEIMFSQPMNESSLNWTISPDPGGWTETWVNDTTVILSHSNLFDPLVTYSFEIVYVEDVHGFELLELPFVLTFTTEL